MFGLQLSEELVYFGTLWVAEEDKEVHFEDGRGGTARTQLKRGHAVE
jgi:hypothetical protein